MTGLRSTLLPALVPFALAALLPGCGGDDDEAPASGGEWPTFLTPAELIDASDIVVVARLGSERTVTVEAPVAEDGSRATAVEIVRTFVVEDSLRGDLLPGDLFNVFNTASISTAYTGGREPSEVTYQVLRIDTDRSYLLFLTLVQVPDYYPDDLGDFAWAAPGEPHTARVNDDGTLTWETTGRYDAARDDRGIPPGSQGAGPAFDVTIDTVAALAREQAPPVPSATP